MALLAMAKDAASHFSARLHFRQSAFKSLIVIITVSLDLCEGGRVNDTGQVIQLSPAQP